MLMILRIHPKEVLLLFNDDLSHVCCDMAPEGRLALIMSNIQISTQSQQRNRGHYV